MWRGAGGQEYRKGRGNRGRGEGVGGEAEGDGGEAGRPPATRRRRAAVCRTRRVCTAGNAPSRPGRRLEQPAGGGCGGLAPATLARGGGQGARGGGSPRTHRCGVPLLEPTWTTGGDFLRFLAHRDEARLGDRSRDVGHTGMSCNARAVHGRLRPTPPPVDRSSGGALLTPGGGVANRRSGRHSPAAPAWPLGWPWR